MRVSRKQMKKMKWLVDEKYIKIKAGYVASKTEYDD